MDTFNRTAIEAEKENRRLLFKANYEMCKAETFSSVNHLLIALDKIVDGMADCDKNKLKCEIDNCYYHVGKIKAYILE